MGSLLAVCGRLVCGELSCDGREVGAVVGDVANFNEYRVRRSSGGFAIRLGDMGRHCLSIGVEVPGGLGFFRASVQALLGSCTGHKGISVFVACRSLSRTRDSIGCGPLVTTRCVGCFGRVRRRFKLRGSVDMSTLTEFPRILAVRRRIRSRRRL